MFRNLTFQPIGGKGSHNQHSTDKDGARFDENNFIGNFADKLAFEHINGKICVFDDNSDFRFLLCMEDIFYKAPLKIFFRHIKMLGKELQGAKFNLSHNCIYLINEQELHSTFLSISQEDKSSFDKK